MAKFCVNITYFAINLQALETYPTCLRQSGMSVGMIIANIFGICGPYVSYIVSISKAIICKIDLNVLSLEQCHRK